MFNKEPTHFALKLITPFSGTKEELCPIIKHVRDNIFNIKRKDGSLMCVMSGTHGRAI